MSTPTDTFDIDSLLDGTLDDLADLPEFKPYPAGTHAVVLTIVDKTAPKNRVNNHPCFEVKMKALRLWNWRILMMCLWHLVQKPVFCICWTIRLVKVSSRNCLPVLLNTSVQRAIVN